VSAVELARAGFFYTGAIDRVQCAFCQGFLRNWVDGDTPEGEHRRHFPDCPFVRGTAVSDNSVEPAVSISSYLLIFTTLRA